jgi:hypothetical protein
VLLTPPEGSAAGGILYRERLRPLLPIEQLVKELNARHPDFMSPTVVAEERLITFEGEYAALVTVRGTLGGGEAQRDLGFVLGDDFYCLVSSLAFGTARFAEASQLARALVVHDRQALGVRRRRFLYDPPPGYAGTPHGFLIDWRAPDAVISVWPANPRDGSDAKSALDALISDERAQGFELHAVAGPDELASRHGLAGFAWEIVGRFPGRPISYRDIVIFEDQRFLYVLRLEALDPATRPAHRQAFAQVARSAQPIPLPRDPLADRDTARFFHWTS